jgi:hypothetical protein
MKATSEQYQRAVQIYESAGQFAIYAYAEEEGIDSWSWCQPCEDSTPDCHDGACLVCGSKKTPVEGKFKIQTLAAFGQWADIKTTEDDGATYEAELFDTEEAARTTIEELLCDIPGDCYRVVPESYPQEFDLY